MNWVKSNEREPLTEGKYHCKYNGVKLVLHFVKTPPKKDDLSQGNKFWTEDINSSTVIKPHGDLVWLDEN